MSDTDVTTVRAPISARESLPAKLDKRISSEREEGLRVRANSERLRAKLAQAASKKPKIQLRRDELADRDIFLEIKRSLERGHVVRLTSEAPAPVRKDGGREEKEAVEKEKGLNGDRTGRKGYLHPIEEEEAKRLKDGRPIGIIRRRIPIHSDDWDAILRIDRERRKRGELEKIFWVPHWTHTGPWLKLLAWSMAVQEAGGSALTAHVSDGVLDAAKGHSRGVARYLQQRLAQALLRTSRELGCPTPEFFIHIETSALKRSHLHGGVTISDDSPDAGAFRKAIYEALYGRSAHHRRRTGREVDLRRLVTGAGWATYIGKWMLQSQRAVEGQTVAASSGMRAMGREWFERARRTGIPMVGGRPPASVELP